MPTNLSNSAAVRHVKCIYTNPSDARLPVSGIQCQIQYMPTPFLLFFFLHAGAGAQNCRCKGNANITVWMVTQ